MSILNKRNALLGWAVWQVSKLAAKRKARQVVKTKPKSRRKSAIVPAVAATGGALWFWRRRRGNDEAGT